MKLKKYNEIRLMIKEQNVQVSRKRDETRWHNRSII